MIELSIPWWFLPAVLAIAAFIVPSVMRSRGDYDFGTPLIQLAIFAAFMAGALGIVLGRWLS